MTGPLPILCLLAATPLAALAQTAFSASALSDFRVRGLSYSQERPVLQLSANHDFANGFYAGAFGSRVRVRGSKVDSVGSIYAGYAGGGRYNWDAGVVQTVYGGARQYRYHEWYAGVGFERIAARLHYAPNYFGTGGRTAYLDINGSVALGEHLEASVHAGFLKPFDNRPGGYFNQLARADWRFGLHAFSGEWSYQLAWSGTRTAAGAFPGWRYGDTRGLVLGATRHF